MKIDLVGPSYVMKSLPYDAQRTINLFPVTDEKGKEISALFGTPGLKLFNDLGNGPGRKCFSSSNGRAFVVSGSGLFELTETGGYTLHGNLDQSTGNISIEENGPQMAICDQKSLYIFTYADNSFVKVTSSGIPSSVGYVTSIDGFFVIIENDSGRFYISSLLDGLTWDALDFATAESNPDNLVSAANCAGQLYLLGERTFEIWTNTGSSAFPFSRISGAIGYAGVMARHTVIVYDSAVLWVGQDKYGNGNVYMTSGFKPGRISTEPIELALNYVTDPTNLTAHLYQEEGHIFYIITGGGLQTSLVYDLTTQQWHERAYLNPDGNYEKHLAADCMYAFGKHLVCDRRNGNVYDLSMSTYDDNGEPIARERVYTHLSDENKIIRFNKLEISMETGVGLADSAAEGYNPVISLQLSKDGAKTWSDWHTAEVGKMGEYRKRVIFRRLGTAFQMTFKVRITDPVKVCLMGSYLV